MTKAKTIDRLEWTRKHSPLLETRDKKRMPESEKQLEMARHEADIQCEENTHKGDICPNCHQPTLIHIEGCERCPNCGYDACAWRDV